MTETGRVKMRLMILRALAICAGALAVAASIQTAAASGQESDALSELDSAVETWIGDLGSQVETELSDEDSVLNAAIREIDSRANGDIRMQRRGDAFDVAQRARAEAYRAAQDIRMETFQASAEGWRTTSEAAQQARSEAYDAAAGALDAAGSPDERDAVLRQYRVSVAEAMAELLVESAHVTSELRITSPETRAGFFEALYEIGLADLELASTLRGEGDDVQAAAATRLEEAEAEGKRIIAAAEAGTPLF